LKPADIKKLVGRLPYMSLEAAGMFYDLITAHDLHNVLELGFMHGVSSAYIAGALQDIGGGRLSTIDLETARDRDPNIFHILEMCGLGHLVEVYFEPHSFNWRLMKFLEESPRRQFDLIYFDAAQTWVDTGFAFLVSHRLLRPGGWIVFDDYHHTYRTSRNSEKPWVLRMPEEEQVIPQVERVFSLLVLEDQSFDTFRIKGNFAFARKRTSDMPGSPEALHVEVSLQQACLRAQADPSFKQKLLLSPSDALAEASGTEPTRFRHVRIIESALRSPSAPDLSETGILTHALEA
jgi:predicted O-methyltransferase YrrM